MSRVLASHLGEKGFTSNVIVYGPFASRMMRATLVERGEGGCGWDVYLIEWQGGGVG